MMRESRLSVQNLSSFLLKILLVLVVSGCAQQQSRTKTHVKPLEQAAPQEEHLVHTVRFSGETLGLIVSCYIPKGWSITMHSYI